RGKVENFVDAAGYVCAYVCVCTVYVMASSARLVCAHLPFDHCQQFFFAALELHCATTLTALLVSASQLLTPLLVGGVYHQKTSAKLNIATRIRSSKRGLTPFHLSLSHSLTLSHSLSLSHSHSSTLFMLLLQKLI